MQFPTSVAVLLSLSILGRAHVIGRAQVTGYGQCGGGASTDCAPGFACESQNPYYSQCLPTPTSAPISTTTVTTTVTTTTSPAGAQQTEYGQCGGSGYNGPTDCGSGLTCSSVNTWYWGCYPATTTPGPSSTTIPGGPVTTTTSAPGSGPTGGSTVPGQYGCDPSGNWQLCNNYWNEDGCGGGEQTTYLDSTSGNTISWHTTYDWPNCGNTPASYSNAEPLVGEGVLLSSVTSIPSTWNWYYESSSDDLRADVSYDLWLGETPNGAQSSSASSYEIMIWVSKKGSITPIGSPIVSSIPVGGYTWDLWGGQNGPFYTYSFIASSGADITSFSTDLLAFFDYLVNNYGVSTSLYVQHVQTGTEPFEGKDHLSSLYAQILTLDLLGSATLVTTSYSAVINS